MLRRMVLAVILTIAVAGSGCTTLFQQFKNDRTPPGGSADDYLKPDPYTKIVVEIDYPSGSAPNGEALERLEAALREATGKPVSIDSKAGLSEFTARGEKGKYTFDEIGALEKANRDRFTGGDTAVIYILYVDGGSTNDDGDSLTLGAVYRGSSVVMFKGNIRQTTRADDSLLGLGATEACLERSVVVHELGHVLGLVNLGTAMVKAHEDTAHPGHSSNKRSVMYYAVEDSGALTTIFTGGCAEIPYQFDENDKADLRAAREG